MTATNLEVADLFLPFDLTVWNEDRVLLLGENGVGKSTLLKVLRDAFAATGVQADDSKVRFGPTARVGYFSQFSKLDGDKSIRTILEAAFSEVQSWERELAEIDATLNSDPEASSLDGLLSRQGDLFERMTDRDGWSYGLKIDTVLTKLGFDAAHRERNVGLPWAMQRANRRAP